MICINEMMIYGENRKYWERLQTNVLQRTFYKEQAKNVVHLNFFVIYIILEFFN